MAVCVLSSSRRRWYLKSKQLWSYSISNPATTPPLSWQLIQIYDQLARPFCHICGKQFVFFVWENVNNLTSSDSRSCEALSCPRWLVPVCHHFLSIWQTLFLIPWFSLRTSWEFVWSIGYEYSIITGGRKLTRTSPVCVFQPRQDSTCSFLAFPALHRSSLVNFSSCYNRVCRLRRASSHQLSGMKLWIPRTPRSRKEAKIFPRLWSL